MAIDPGARNIGRLMRALQRLSADALGALSLIQGDGITFAGDEISVLLNPTDPGLTLTGGLAIDVASGQPFGLTGGLGLVLLADGGLQVTAGELGIKLAADSNLSLTVDGLAVSGLMLEDISDAGTAAAADVGDFAAASHTHTLSDISDAGTAAAADVGDFAAASHTHDTSDVVTGTFADARIAQSNVTQHEAALAIDYSQLASVPSTFTPSAHTHTLSDVSDAGTAAAYDVPASGDAADDEVVLGNDSRLGGLPVYRWMPYHITAADITPIDTLSGYYQFLSDATTAQYSAVVMDAFIHTAVPWSVSVPSTANELFGYSVAIDGDLYVVGAPGYGSSSGAAYVFRVSTGELVSRLFASDAASGDNFGWAVGISGTTVIVGAPLDGSGTGAAYTFNAETGQQQDKLTASDAASGDNFGWSVGIAGDIAIVGAPLDNSSTGAAYLFTVSTATETYKLTASNAGASDNFGYSVAITEDRAIVGAWQEDTGGTNAGAAYIFNTSTGAETYMLTASDAATSDTFGWSVGISGNIAIVGSRLDDDTATNTGSAYLFNVSTGAQLFKLVASDAQDSDFFGYSVGISDGIAVVGAWQEDAGGSNAGAAYIFNTSTGAQISKLVASDAAAGDLFGVAVAVSDGVSLIGARLDDDVGDASGSSYIFNAAGSQIYKSTPIDGTVDIHVTMEDSSSPIARTVIAQQRLYPRAVGDFTGRGPIASPSLVAAGTVTMTAEILVDNGVSDLSDLSQGDSTIWILWGIIGPDLRDP